MVGIRRSVEVSDMARGTGCRREAVVVIDVALSTLQCCVGSRKCKTCECCVIKSGRTPGRCGMASLARLRESRSNVVWTCGAGEVFLVAPITECWKRRVIPVHVACGAGDRHMSAG